MGSKLTSFGAGLALAGLVSAALLQSGPAFADWPLCVNGHPAKRPPDCTAQLVPGCIIYGGLPPKRGFQRDHWYPEGICRGEPWCDIAATDPTRPPSATNPGNVWYQPLAQAKVKDDEEWMLEADVCADRVTILGAEAQIEKDWGDKADRAKGAAFRILGIGTSVGHTAR